MIKKTLTLALVLGMMLAIIMPGASAIALDSGAESGFKKGISNSGGTSSSDIAGSIQDIINLLLFLAGIIAVIVIVISGLRYVLSDGDSGQASKAKNTLVYALIGLVVAVMSYAMVNFILGNLH